MLDFSLPYYASDFGVLMLAGESVRDLGGARALRWTVVEGARQQAFLDDTIRPDEPVHVVADDVAAAEAISVGGGRRGADRPVERAHPGARRRSPRCRGQVRQRRQYSVALPKGSVNLEKVDAALRGFQRDGTLNTLAETWLLPHFLDIARRGARDRNELKSLAARPRRPRIVYPAGATWIVWISRSPEPGGLRWPRSPPTPRRPTPRRPSPDPTSSSAAGSPTATAHRSRSACNSLSPSKPSSTTASSIGDNGLRHLRRRAADRRRRSFHRFVRPRR